MVAGEYRQAAEGFHALQEVVDFDVGVTVVAVFDFAAFAEQGVGFVEEQDCAAAFGSVEDAPQVLFGFADVFGDDAREVDAVQVELEFVGDHFGGHGFAGAAFSGEQGADAESSVHAFGKTPVFVDDASGADLLDQLFKRAVFVFGQHELVFAGFDGQALRERIKPGSGQGAAGVPGGLERALSGECQGVRDLLNVGLAEVELRGQLRGVLAVCWAECVVPGAALFERCGLLHFDAGRGAFEACDGFAGGDEDDAVASVEEAPQGVELFGFVAVVRVNQEGDGAQQAFALPEHGQGFEFVEVGGQVLEWQPVEQAVQAGGGVLGHELLRIEVWSDELNDWDWVLRVALDLTQGCFNGKVLTEWQLGLRVAWAEWREQAGEPVVQAVQAFDRVDDAFIGPQGAAGQGLAGGLVDLEQPVVTQRPVGGECIPAGFVFEQGHGERKGRVGPCRVVLGSGAQGGDVGVGFHGAAQEQDVLIETGQPKALGNLAEHRWWL